MSAFTRFDTTDGLDDFAVSGLQLLTGKTRNILIIMHVCAEYYEWTQKYCAQIGQEQLHGESRASR